MKVTDSNRASFGINTLDKIEWLGEEWIVVEIKEAWTNGTPAKVINLNDGREGLPMIEECKLISKHLGISNNSTEVSQETAELFTDWRRIELEKLSGK